LDNFNTTLSSVVYYPYKKNWQNFKIKLCYWSKEHNRLTDIPSNDSRIHILLSISHFLQNASHFTHKSN
jgi:hypothetical protein